ncbi:MAG TPA: hypothetical protein VHC46_01215 [Thermodesulfobacteriota bacterium]|nr:hypothetical protein [Candidatus Paceibacterota bacterium]HVY54355.1 hypothetical protein [Thermodesulfobacteriota bacterium]
MKTAFKKSLQLAVAATGLVFIALVIFAPAKIALAQETYKPLTTIPNAFTENQPTDPVSLVKNIYGISIGIAAILAVCVIIYAGVLYTTSEAIGQKTDAKARWQHALIGLLILLSAYIILRTINVSLVNINLNTLTTTCGSNGVPCGSSVPQTVLQELLNNSNAAVTAYQKAEADKTEAQRAVTAAQAILISAQASGDTESIAKAQAALEEAQNIATAKTIDAGLKRIDSAAQQSTLQITQAVNGGDADKALEIAADALKIETEAASKITDPAAQAQAQANIRINTESQRVIIAAGSIINGMNTGAYPTALASGQEKFQTARASFLSETSHVYAQLKQSDPTGADRYRVTVIAQLKKIDEYRTAMQGTYGQIKAAQ